MKTPTLYRYTFPRTRPSPTQPGQEWAEVILCQSGFFGACSGWGDYAHRWAYPGVEDFREFFLTPQDNLDYFCRKLSGCQRVYDPDETLKAAKQLLLETRRNRSISQDDARDEWDALHGRFDGLCNEAMFTLWCDDTALEVVEIYRDKYPEDVQQFCREVLPRLAEAIRQELDKENPQPMSVPQGGLEEAGLTGGSPPTNGNESPVGLDGHLIDPTG